jgi:hypothetical protein
MKVEQLQDLAYLAEQRSELNEFLNRTPQSYTKLVASPRPPFRVIDQSEQDIPDSVTEHESFGERVLQAVRSTAAEALGDIEKQLRAAGVEL